MFPGRRNHQRHQKRREHHKGEADAIHAHLVRQAERPILFFNVLKAAIAWIKLKNDEERDNEGHGSGNESHPFGVAPSLCIITA